MKEIRRNASFMLEPRFLRAIAAAAKAQRLSKSEVMNRVLESWIEREGQAMALLSMPEFSAVLVKALSQPGMVRQLAAAMGEEVNPEQLPLFTQAMEQVGKAVAAEAEKAKGQVKGKAKGKGR